MEIAYAVAGNQCIAATTPHSVAVEQGRAGCNEVVNKRRVIEAFVTSKSTNETISRSLRSVRKLALSKKTSCREKRSTETTF